MKTYEQKIGKTVRERLTVHDGMATLEKFDDRGKPVAKETFGTGDGRVTQFIHRAEPRK